MKVIKNIETITGAEWNVMRIIWSLGSCTTRQIIDNLKKESGWKDSTIKTLLARLIKKGFLTTKKEDRHFIYSPLISEQDAMNETAEELFTHMCAMKNGQTLNDVIKKIPISKHDIADLITMLKDKEKDAPEKVDCNCLPNGNCK